MQIHSRGLRSDLALLHLSSDVHDRGDYIAVHTPSNHGFFWGNFLLFARAPRPGDVVEWPRCFEREFGRYADIHHQAFTWDLGPDDRLPTLASTHRGFQEAGFDVHHTTVMIADQVLAPATPNREIVIAPIETEKEWLDIIDLQITTDTDELEPVAFRRFMERRFVAYRALVEAGLGHWFGARIGGDLVADLGIFWGGGVARFQNVETRAEFRGQGICSTLVHHVGSWVSSRSPGTTLVIEAATDEPAGRIYQRLGFLVAEQLTSYCRAQC
jgi:GNAT superfamily N-acetyltransferase